MQASPVQIVNYPFAAMKPAFPLEDLIVREVVLGDPGPSSLVSVFSRARALAFNGRPKDPGLQRPMPGRSGPWHRTRTHLLWTPLLGGFSKPLLV